MPRTVIALYDRLEAARDAVDALIKNGYTHVDISLAAAKADAEGIHNRGTLVVVQAPDNMVDETGSILKRFKPVNMDLHPDARRLEELGAVDHSRRLGDQPTNLETKSEVAMVEQTGQTAFPPDEHDGSITMRDADRESRRAERGETPESGPAAGYDAQETGVGSTGSPDRPADSGETTSFDAYEPLFRQHYVTSYSHVGRDYEVLRPAYAFGYGLANDPRFRNHEWDDVEGNARDEWELSHMDSPWEEFKDAVREAWDAVRGWD